MMMSEWNSSRYPFTASQWQELTHQALIFKYMASGQSIPSDLIIPIKRSFFLNSTVPPFPHQPNIGWGSFQMGLGRKTEDPQPGRCRRTDGKKWRCSKEAYPDSKYCERHMHRGKNRSRKHVEMSLTTNPTITTTTTSLSMAASGTQHLLYPYSTSSSSTSSRAPGLGFLPQNNNAHLHMDTGSSSPDKDYRYFHGLKNGVDEYTFFSDASGTQRSSSWHLTQLGMSSLCQPKQRTEPKNYPHLTDMSREEGKEKRQHCFVLGADFKLSRPVKEEREEEESFYKTQLSISIPMAHHELPMASSQSHNND